MSVGRCVSLASDDNVQCDMAAVWRPGEQVDTCSDGGGNDKCAGSGNVHW